MFLLGAERRLQGLADGLRDFRLNGKEVIGGDFAVVVFRPEMLVRFRIDQLHIDTHLLTRALYCALQDGRHTKLGADFAQVLGGVTVFHHGGARDHFELANLGQLCQQVIVHAVGEEPVILNAAARCKGQNRD